MVTLGGFVNSSAVILWSLLAPLGALLASGRRTATYWFVAFAGLVVMSRILEPSVRATNNLSDDVVLRFFVLNIVGLSFVAFVLLQYFVGQRDEAMALLNVEKEKSERLLLNILPEEIAERLKVANTMIADHYESASVLFADIVDFTPMSARMSPQELVGLLNDVFTTFDGFVAELGLEKIKTVGDAYMVASGVPGARPDHADAIAELALRIRDHVAANQFDGHEITLRIGINSGPVVAGIIGTDKFAYDLWGDAVNTASRMESAGVAGSIQLTPATYELIRDTFVCEPRGVVSVKGKGDMDTYLLISRRADARASG